MRRNLVCLTVASILMSGCAIGPNYKRPAVETPEQYKYSGTTPAADATASTTPAATPAAIQPDQWWTLFDDTTLNDLEAQVEVSNQNLAASEAAYREATAAIREQRAAFFPQISLDAGVTRSGGQRRSTTSTGTDVTSGDGRNIYQAGASASWEIDLWGRLRRSLENSRSLAEASAADLAFAKLSIQGQLAIAYLQLREADAEQRLLLDTVSAYTRSLEIAQNRYTVGVAAKTDVLQAQTQLANAQDQATALTLQRAQLEHAIAALDGKP
ncbi:MAG: TolC family protein, partial [Gammaproteobacteria bacterium]